MLLAAACQFLSHTCLTKHLVVSSWGILTRTFSDSVLKTTLTWRRPSGRLSMFRYWSILSLFSFTDAWSLSCTNSKDFCEDFPLFVLVAGDNTRTDLQIGLFPSRVSSKRLFAEVDFGGVAAVNSVILPCNDSWTNEYSDPRFRIFRSQGLQTRLECLSHFTTSNPALWRFWAKISTLQPFLLDGLKRFSVEILLLPNLTLKLQLHSLHCSFGFIRNSLFPQCNASEMFLNYFGSARVLGKFTSARKTKHFIGVFMTAVDRIKCRYAHSGMTSGVGGFQNPGVCLQAFPSFLPHPLPAYSRHFSRGPCSETARKRLLRRLGRIEPMV